MEETGQHWHAYYLAAGGRIWWTDGRWRYESKSAANKAAQKHQPESARRMVRQCAFADDRELCPALEAVPIAKRRDDR